MFNQIIMNNPTHMYFNRAPRANQTINVPIQPINCHLMCYQHQTAPIGRPGGKITLASSTVQMARGRKYQGHVLTVTP